METALMAMAMVGLAMTGAAIALLWTRRKFVASPLPDVGCSFKLRAIAGIYRAKFMGFERDGWRLSPPLQRNQYVPIEPGDLVTIEAPTSSGVYLYRTRILRRATDGHDLIIAAPTGIKPVDRRQEFRLQIDRPIRLDGEAAHMVDISRHGARLKASLRFRRGDRVKVDYGDGMVYAWILDLWPTRSGDDFPAELRVRFEETVELPVPGR